MGVETRFRPAYRDLTQGELRARTLRGLKALEECRLCPRDYGVVDVYMPDFKVWSRERAKRWLMAGDYPEAARAAILEMHRQVGPLVLDARGLATRGVLIRHLVMPGALDETRAILAWIAAELGPGSYVNVMDQYRPSGRVLERGRFPELETRTGRWEHEEAVRMAIDLGLRVDGVSA